MKSPNETILGLLISLSDDASLAAQVYSTLAKDESLSLGERMGVYLPLVAETDNPRALHRRLEAMEGIGYVDVTFVTVDGEPPVGTEKAI